MKTVIEMAVEAELVYWMSNLARTKGRWWMDAGEPGEELERFAELVRADERNDTLDEVAKKIEAMPFGDTAASFAVWIKEQKT